MSMSMSTAESGWSAEAAAGPALGHGPVAPGPVGLRRPGRRGGDTERPCCLCGPAGAPRACGRRAAPCALGLPGRRRRGPAGPAGRGRRQRAVPRGAAGGVPDHPWHVVRRLAGAEPAQRGVDHPARRAARSHLLPRRRPGRRGRVAVRAGDVSGVSRAGHRRRAGTGLARRRGPAAAGGSRGHPGTRLHRSSGRAGARPDRPGGRVPGRPSDDLGRDRTPRRGTR